MDRVYIDYMGYYPLNAERVSQDLLLVKSTRISGLWKSATSRKTHTCIACQKTRQAGDRVFRPMGNTDFRMKRICLSCVDRAAPPLTKGTQDD